MGWCLGLVFCLSCGPSCGCHFTWELTSVFMYVYVTIVVLLLIMHDVCVYLASYGTVFMYVYGTIVVLLIMGKIMHVMDSYCTVR